MIFTIGNLKKVGAGLAHGLAEAREAEDEGLEDRRALVVGDEAGAQERPDLGEASPESEPTTGLRGAFFAAKTHVSSRLCISSLRKCTVPREICQTLAIR